MRKYSSIASEKTLTQPLPASGVGQEPYTLYLNDTIGLPNLPEGSTDTFVMVIEPDTANEEIVYVTAVTGGTQLTVTRNEETAFGTPAKSHNAGVKARHMIVGSDLQLSQTHIAATTGVHGIADTSVLATNSSVSTAVSNHNATTFNIHGIADTSALATKTYADGAVSTHSADTTDVHGIANTANLPNIVSALAGRTIYVQAAEPTSPVNGDIWFDLP